MVPVGELMARSGCDGFPSLSPHTSTLPEEDGLSVTKGRLRHTEVWPGHHLWRLNCSVWGPTQALRGKGPEAALRLQGRSRGRSRGVSPLPSPNPERTALPPPLRLSRAVMETRKQAEKVHQQKIRETKCGPHPSKGILLSPENE